MNLRAPTAINLPVSSAVALVGAVGEAQDRRVDAERQKRFDAAASIETSAPRHALTPHEIRVINLMCTRHGVSRERATAAVLRSRPAPQVGGF